MAEPFIGEIKVVGFNFAPRGWALCDGQLLSISQNTALFSLLGTTYGGDGQTTFGLPDLRGRNVRGVGSGAGLDTVTWGERAGSPIHYLTVAQLPSHNHSYSVPASTFPATGDDPSGQYPAGGDFYHPTADTTMGAGTTGNVGGNQPFNILNPYLGMYVCIALQGIFPSRN